MVWSPFFPHVYPGVYGLARMVWGTVFFTFARLKEGGGGSKAIWAMPI